MTLKHDFLNFLFANRILISKIHFNLFFAWLPIKKNKIVFSNYYGCGYGCNPKYIAEEIIKQKLPVEIVWITKPEFIAKKEFPKQIKLVNFCDTNKCLFEQATASIWIDNMHKIKYIKQGLKKKKNQFYLNTWHGSLGIKRIEGDVEKLNRDIVWKCFAIKNSDMVDVFVSNSDFETNVYKRALWFKNKITEIGHPRNDIFFNANDDLADKIKKQIKVEKNTRIALYVPSFRDNLRTNYFDLNYKLLKETLDNKTGENWQIITKFHPKNLYKLQYLNNASEYQKDVSLYPDIQELLYVSDLIISDYSSCMFDFMLTRKPCFIYATDIEEYNTERGFYYPLESTPFPIAKNNEELMQNIRSFNQKDYIEQVNKFLDNKKCIDDGYASKKVVDLIKEVLNV